MEMIEAIGDTNVYWSEADVAGGKWIVMPNLRVAKLHHICKDSGRRVFITANSKLVCEHGECASSIGSWVSAEQRANLEGKDALDAARLGAAGAGSRAHAQLWQLILSCAGAGIVR